MISSSSESSGGSGGGTGGSGQNSGRGGRCSRGSGTFGGLEVFGLAILKNINKKRYCIS